MISEFRKEDCIRMSFFSIIIPVYNAEKYVEKCINSVANQTFTDIEIIVIDDGSTDNSLKIIKEMSLKDERIKIISQANSGQVIARNTGIVNSSGKYIGFVDADDYIEEDLFRTVYNVIIEYESDIIMFDSVRHLSDGMLKDMRMKYDSGLYDKAKLKKNVYPNMLYSKPFYNFGCYPCLWNKVFKKEIIMQANADVPTDIRNGEDACASYKAMLMANSMYYLKNYVGYHYNTNEESVTQKGNHSTVDSVIHLTDYMCQDNIYMSEPIMHLQVMYYGALMYTMIVADLTRKDKWKIVGNCKEAKRFYKKLSSSLFGKELYNEYKNLKNLPEYERILIERVFNNGINNTLKLIIYKIKNKL